MPEGGGVARLREVASRPADQGWAECLVGGNPPRGKSEHWPEQWRAWQAEVES